MLSQIHRFDLETFTVPEEQEHALQYALNLGMVRPYAETCKFYGGSDGAEWWKCDLETALALHRAGDKTTFLGKTVLISNPEPIESKAVSFG